MTESAYVPQVQEPEDEYHEDPNYNPANDNVDLATVGDAHYAEAEPEPEVTA